MDLNKLQSITIDEENLPKKLSEYFNLRQNYGNTELREERKPQNPNPPHQPSSSYQQR